MPFLIDNFGKFGHQLHQQSHGIDHREVVPDRIRKSLSVEETLEKNIQGQASCLALMDELFKELLIRLGRIKPEKKIKNQYIKLKYFDFKQVTIERVSHSVAFEKYKILLEILLSRSDKAIRLMGLGVHFDDANDKALQYSFFDE